MSTNKDSNEEISASTNQQRSDTNNSNIMNQSQNEDLPSASENIEEIDAAQADESDSWETDDEGDFYTEQHNGRLLEQDYDDGLFNSGLSRHLIQCYPITTAEEASVVGVVCDICLTEYRTHDKVRTIPCLHRFHTRCIDKWFQKSTKCPMCRSDLRKSKWYSS